MVCWKCQHFIKPSAPLMYLVMTAAVLSGIYLSGHLLIAHEMGDLQTAMEPTTAPFYQPPARNHFGQ